MHNTCVVPMLQQESSTGSFRNDSMPSLMNTSLNSVTSGVTFYQSTSEFNFADDHRNYNVHHVQSNENTVATPQRGIDRSITLPREHHLKLDPDSTRNELASPHTPVYSTTSPHQPSRTQIQRSNGMTMANTTGSPTSNSIVTPEVTRPSKNMRRGLSTSSIPSMPPLHPSTPQSSSPKRYLSSMSISKSTRSSPIRTTLPYVSTSNTHPMTPLRTDLACNRTSSDVTGPRTEYVGINTAMEVTETNTPNDNSSNTASSSNMELVMIDIAPGVRIRLRGADETESAISNGFYVHCDCMFCSISDFTSSTNRSTGTTSALNLNLNQDDELYCILDCDYFICPSCLSINPNPISMNANTPELPSVTTYQGGLGLGFRLENGKYRPS
jgi:hypothetical protein